MIKYLKTSFRFIIFAVIVLFIAYFLNVNNTYFFPKEITEKSSIVVDSSSTNKPSVEVYLDDYSVLNSKAVNYEVSNSGDLEDYFLVFELTGLSPNTTYNSNVSFDFYSTGSDKVYIDITDFKPGFGYDDSRLYSGVSFYNDNGDSEFKEFNVINNSTKISTQIEFTSDSDGNAYLLIGQKLDDVDNFTMSISNLKVTTREVL